MTGLRAYIRTSSLCESHSCQRLWGPREESIVVETTHSSLLSYNSVYKAMWRPVPSILWLQCVTCDVFSYINQSSILAELELLLQLEILLK